MSDETGVLLRVLLDEARSRVSSGDGAGALQLTMQAARLVDCHDAAHALLRQAFTSLQLQPGGEKDLEQLEALLAGVQLASQPGRAGSSASAGPSGQQPAGAAHAQPQRSQEAALEGAQLNRGVAWSPAGPAAQPLAQALRPMLGPLPGRADSMDISCSSGASMSSGEGWEAGEVTSSGGHAYSASAAAEASARGRWATMAGEPILTETGREGLTDCALADGSHYTCVRCGGVVLVRRREQHEQFWCQ